MRELNILGTYNIRDLGGYITQNDEILKYRALIRSGNLDKLPETSQRRLLNYGIQTIIDVRDEWEVKHYPNPFENSDAISFHNLPLIGDDFSNDEHFKVQTRDYSELSKRYNKYIESCQPQIGRILAKITESEAGIIIHCHAGKDRTGIIIALILASLGVSSDEIAQDYALSNQHIQHLIADWRAYAKGKGHDMAQFERDNATLPETILTMLAHVKENYGRVDNYLEHCGLSSEQVDCLKSKFLK